ncbi:BrnA antitoxin family protein [Thermaurantiacus tibetensis]|uniref:BrnA antitoxin family protein n=1 Tax=Thermaurantiacus tibetensis TaxID=2759035 RepID=UPI00189097CF|nr:BrnA antitoxin family protein [Thermaurantiacus tibetensis]
MPRRTERPPVFDDDNPEWTAEDFARARPVSEFPELAAAFPRRPGRPKGSTRSDRQQVALRLPRHVIAHFRAGGPGWQTRIVATLEGAVREAEKQG